MIGNIHESNYKSSIFGLRRMHTVLTIKNRSSRRVSRISYIFIIFGRYVVTCYLLHSNDRSRASLPVVKKDVALIHISRSLVIFYPKPDTDCNSVVQDTIQNDPRPFQTMYLWCEIDRRSSWDNVALVSLGHSIYDITFWTASSNVSKYCTRVFLSDNSKDLILRIDTQNRILHSYSIRSWQCFQRTVTFLNRTEFL